MQPSVNRYPTDRRIVRVPVHHDQRPTAVVPKSTAVTYNRIKVRRPVGTTGVRKCFQDRSHITVRSVRISVIVSAYVARPIRSNRSVVGVVGGLELYGRSPVIACRAAAPNQHCVLYGCISRNAKVCAGRVYRAGVAIDVNVLHVAIAIVLPTLVGVAAVAGNQGVADDGEVAAEARCGIAELLLKIAVGERKPHQNAKEQEDTDTKAYPGHCSPPLLVPSGLADWPKKSSRKYTPGLASGARPLKPPKV